MPQSLQIVETDNFVVLVFLCTCGHSGFRAIFLLPPSVDTNLRAEVLFALHHALDLSLCASDAVHPTSNIRLELGCVNHALEGRPLVLQLRTFVTRFSSRPTLVVDDAHACVPFVLILATFATSSERLDFTVVDTHTKC